MASKALRCPHPNPPLFPLNTNPTCTTLNNRQRLFEVCISSITTQSIICQTLLGLLSKSYIVRKSNCRLSRPPPFDRSINQSKGQSRWPTTLIPIVCFYYVLITIFISHPLCLYFLFDTQRQSACFRWLATYYDPPSSCHCSRVTF